MSKPLNPATLKQAERELEQLEGFYKELSADAALTAASMAPPPAGTAADVVSLGRSLWKGDWGGALLDAVGIIPIVGDGIKGVTKGTKIAAKMKEVSAAIKTAKIKLAKMKKNAAAKKTKATKDATKNKTKNNSVQACKKCDKEAGGGIIGGKDATTVITHKAGNRQVDINDQRWNVPKNTSVDKIPSSDSVGDSLQKAAREAGRKWNPKRNLTRNERRAIRKAHKSDEHWRANLLEKQAKGRWVEKQVKNKTKKLGLDIEWSRTGADVTDTKTGIKYDIMSGTKSNMDTHAKRMPNDLFRMITF